MRTLLLALAAAFVLAVPSLADAKELLGAQLCGTDGCVTERTAGLHEGTGGPFGGSGEVVKPSAPAPWLRGFVLAGDRGKVFGRIPFFYVPSADLVVQGGDQYQQPAWSHPQGAFADIVHRLAERVRPYSAPTNVSVSVDGRAVEDPQSYLRLYTIGKKTEAYPTDARSLQVDFHSTPPTPWSTGNDVVVYPGSNLLMRDGEMVSISSSVTKAVVSRQSLDVDGGVAWATIALALAAAAAAATGLVALRRRLRVRGARAPVPQA